MGNSEYQEKQLLSCAVSMVYLEQLFDFSPMGITQDNYLGPINGVVSKNMGLLKSSTMGKTKFRHVYAFALTLLERWILQTFYASNEDPDLSEMHYAYWASAQALFKLNGHTDFQEVHQIAMTFYSDIPIYPDYGQIVSKLLIATNGKINRPDLATTLVSGLEAMNFLIRMSFRDDHTNNSLLSQIRSKVTSYMAREDSLRAVLDATKAPGSLFDLIHKSPTFSGTADKEVPLGEQPKSVEPPSRDPFEPKMDSCPNLESNTIQTEQVANAQESTQETVQETNFANNVNDSSNLKQPIEQSAPQKAFWPPLIKVAFFILIFIALVEFAQFIQEKHSDRQIDNLISTSKYLP